MSQSDVNVSDDVLLNNLGPGFAEFDNLGMDDFEFDRLDDLLTQHQLSNNDEQAICQISFKNQPDDRCDVASKINLYSPNQSIPPCRTIQLQLPQVNQQHPMTQNVNLTQEEFQLDSSPFYQNPAGAFWPQDKSGQVMYPLGKANWSTRNTNGQHPNQTSVVDHNFRRSPAEAHALQAQRQDLLQRKLQFIQEQKQHQLEQQLVAQQQMEANQAQHSQHSRGVVSNSNGNWPSDLYKHQSALYAAQSAAKSASAVPSVDRRCIMTDSVSHPNQRNAAVSMNANRQIRNSQVNKSPHAVVPVNSPPGSVISSDCLHQQNQLQLRGSNNNVVTGGGALEDWPGDVLTLDGFDETALETLLQELVDTDNTVSDEVQSNQIIMSRSQQNVTNKNW